MDSKTRLTGHAQVKPDKNGRTRSYYAFWRDANGKKHGGRIGAAHVRDTGRRTARGAIIWRAGDGPKPTPEHLTPRGAEARLDEILRASEVEGASSTSDDASIPLHLAAEAWLAERDLKRSTIADYEDMFERLYRDLGADTPIAELDTAALRTYFASFKAERLLGEQAAQRALAQGKEVTLVYVQRWTVQPHGSQAMEVATMREAVRLAAKIGGTWKHRRRGCYRVTATGAERPKRVSRATARVRQSEGWIVAQRTQPRWMLRTLASAQTRNKYRDILAAILDRAVEQGELDANPAAKVKRASNRQARQRVLTRSDFYDKSEVYRLLRCALSEVEEAFWLCGAHAGFRLPGEALGLRWGAVDFEAGVIRVYDNWVRNAADGTKTPTTAAIPMTPRLAAALRSLKARGWATQDDDFVFASDLPGQPISEQAIRKAFKLAQQAADLKPIRMYNLRHSFGTGLAREGIDVRTIQALMRHERLSTTEQYLAYAPQPDLAKRLARALDT